MLDFIKHCDLLSSNTSLYLNGHKSLKNKLGGILTINIFILGLILFFFYFSKIIDRIDPSVSMNKVYTPESKYYLNTSESIFGFTILDRMAGFVNETYYTPVVQHWKYTFNTDDSGVRKLSYKIENLNFSKCDQIKINSTEFTRVYSKLDLSNNWCLDPGQIIEIKNPYAGAIDYSYINVIFTHCTHLGEKCEKKEKIEDVLTSYIANIFFTSYYVDNLNYEEPLQPYGYFFSEFSSSAYYKRIFHEIKTLDHISDGGFVLSDSKKQSKIALEDIKSVFDFRNSEINGGKVLFQFSYIFNKNSFKDTYYRSYKKIQMLLAEVGGFLNFIKSVGLLFVFVYTEIIYIPLTYNGFSFYLDENSQSGTKINDSLVYIVKKNINFPNLENNVNCSFNAPRKSVYNLRNNTLNENKIHNDPKLSQLPSSCEILKNYVICWRKKLLNVNSKTFLAAKKKLISNYLNISSLIRMHNELSILKQMLFKSKKDQSEFSSAVKMIRIKENEENSQSIYINAKFNFELDLNKINENYLNNS